MVSAVRSRPNHYETLGVSSSASEDEISQAFARKMSELRWHPVGSKAVICIAYETLRDSAKRRAYDLSLGLISKSAPRQWGFAVTPQRWAFIAAEPSDPAAARTAPLPEPHVTSEPQPEPRDEPRVASFIASSLRDLARPMAPAGAQPLAQPKPDAVDARLERHLEEMVTARLAAQGSADDAEARGPDWKRPVLAVGGFVIAAGLIGTLAGMSVKDDAVSAQVEPVPMVAHAAKPNVAPRAAAPEAAAIQTGDRASERTARSVSRQPSVWAKRQIHEVQSTGGAAGQADSDALASNEPANDPLAPQPAAATLPLSNSAVAHTLDRVGYSCGLVTSTTAVGGGAFKVTCTSGKTYRATRVHGRYRFSRLGTE